MGCMEQNEVLPECPNPPLYFTFYESENISPPSFLITNSEIDNELCGKEIDLKILLKSKLDEIMFKALLIISSTSSVEENVQELHMLTRDFYVALSKYRDNEESQCKVVEAISRYILQLSDLKNNMAKMLL